ncbi:hypothetical protein MGN70_014480 [Eutypa lata]|nr:hypothetical protein MGN70_014480 [Eutypa lata]
MLYDDIPAVSLPAEDYEPLPVVFQSAPGNESDGIITVKVVGEINSKNGETANVVNLTTAKVDNITQLITQAGGVELVKTTNTTVIRFPKLLKTELYHINWFWCARAYGKVTASSSRLHMELSNTRKLEWVATLRSAESSPSTASGTTIVDIKDSIAPLMYEIDLETFTENIAEALTNQMRSNTAGDNMDATIVLGEAFTNETFIHARWEWLILPLFLATLTGCLLVL